MNCEGCEPISGDRLSTVHAIRDILLRGQLIMSM